MDRRTFLLAGGASAGSLLTAAVPGSSSDRRLRRMVDQLRRHRDRVQQRSLRRVGATHPDAEQATWARGAGAMAAIDRLAGVRPRDQAHPAVQQLIAELVGEVGAGLQVLRALYAELAEEPEDPPAGWLDLAFRRARAGLAEEELSPASQTLQHNDLDQLEAELHEEGLRPRLRREARRLARLEALAARIALVGGETAVLTPADPSLLAELEAGANDWKELAGPPVRPTAVEVLGLIGCGLGILVGSFLVLLGVACALSCEAPGLLLLALLGALVIGACVAGLLGISRAMRRRREGAPLASD